MEEREKWRERIGIGIGIGNLMSGVENEREVLKWISHLCKMVVSV